MLIALIALLTLMYLEGLIMAGVVVATLKPSRFFSALIFLLWPVALPVASYMLYLKFKPMLEVVKPLMGITSGMLLSQQDIGGMGLIANDDFTYEKQ